MAVNLPDRSYDELQYLRSPITQGVFDVFKAEQNGATIIVMSKVALGEDEGLVVTDRFDLAKDFGIRKFKWFVTRWPEYYDEIALPNGEYKKQIIASIEVKSFEGKRFIANAVESKPTTEGKVFINLQNYKTYEKQSPPIVQVVQASPVDELTPSNFGAEEDIPF